MVYLLKDNRTGKPGNPMTKFSIERKANHLICTFEALGASLNSYSCKDNDELYKADVVELFLYIGEENAYLEIEVSPNGARFVANIINKEIHFIDSSFVKTKVVSGKDSYNVKMDIDLSMLDVKDELEFNAYRIETMGIESNYILLAVNPTMCGSFHVRESFIKL